MEAEDGENNGDSMEGTKGARFLKSEETPQGNTQQDGESSSHLMEPVLSLVLFLSSYICLHVTYSLL